MPAVDQLPADQLALARKVDELLDALSGELDASINPHRVALRSLGVNAMGWTEAPYNDEAFQIWHDLLQRDPNDIETLHHLAIAHHARAIDREASNKPEEANADWETALSYWETLWKSDAFWDRIAERACPDGKRQAVDDLRNELPELLLRVHFDLAFDPATPRSRANYHVALASRAAFSDESKFAARSRVYDRIVSVIPANVWQNDMLDPDTIKQGTDAIEKYLTLDPGFTLALADALRLQVRLLTARYSELQAAGAEDQAARNRLLNELAESADYWSMYFEQLVEHVSTVEDDARQKLCLWYRVMGQIYGAVSRNEDAARFFEQGVRAGTEDDDNRRTCLKERGETQAYVARERAGKDDSDAKAYCDRVRQMPGLSPTAHLLLAQAYTVLEEFDLAEEVCRAGMAIEPDVLDFEAMQGHEHDQQRLAELLNIIRVKRLITQAHERMDAEDHQAAADLLGQAIDLDPDTPVLYFYRSRCYGELEHFDRAQHDIDTFLQMTSDPEEQEIALKVKEDLTERGKLHARYGSAAMALRRKAIEAHNAERFEQAAGFLRQAVEACEKDGQADLKRELANTLAQWAISEVNAITDDKGGARDKPSSEARMFVLQRAAQRLEEAVKLNPSDDGIKQNLEALKSIQAQEVSQFHEKGHKLMQGGNHRQALEPLNTAVKLDPDNPISRFLRCQCNLELDNIADAQADIKRLKVMSLDSDVAEAVARLAEEVSEREQAAAKFGQQAPKLRRQAVRAANEEKFSQASDLLREAIRVCPSTGRSELQKDLAQVLTNWAVSQANIALGNNALSENGKERACEEALGRLDEAVRLDPQNSHIASQRSALKDAVSSISENARYEAMKRELEAEFGSMRVLELRGKAIEQFNSNNFSAAAASLGEALKVIPAGHPGGRATLSRELSLALTAWASSMVGGAGGHITKDMAEVLVGMLEEAVRLDPSNISAADSLQQLRNMLRR